MQIENNTAFYKQGSRQIFEDTSLSINWKLTDMCNYACSYCFGQYKLRKERFSTWAHLQQAVQNIAYLNRSSYRVTLAGGEPTAHPHFFELLNEFPAVLQDKLKGINIITNGSRNTKLYHHIASTNFNTPISLHISIHSEFAQLQHIKELITQTAHVANLNFKCMFNYKKFAYVKEICQELIALRKDYPFTFSITKLRIPPEFTLLDPQYTQEHLDWEKTTLEQFAMATKQSTQKSTFTNAFPCTVFYENMKDGNIEIVKHPVAGQQMQKGFRNFTHMYCAMGTNVMRIHPNGQCNGAVCGISSKNNKNIFDENFSIQDNFIRLVHCSRENCGCISDLVIPKFSDKALASAFLTDFKNRLQQSSAPIKQCASWQSTINTLKLRWQVRNIL